MEDVMNCDFKKVLVTGGAGFIGSHLVDALVDSGCQVTVLDNLSTGKSVNLEHLQGRITFLRGDIQDPEALIEAMAGCDVVFHQAAVVSVSQTVEEPLESAIVNDLGTLRVLETARQAGVRRVVLASSCAVYGDDPRLPKYEGMRPGCKSPYALQKLTGENYAHLYHELYGLETVCLRYFNVYGPRQDPGSPYSGVISIFMSRACNGRAPVIYGDGRQSRDFVFVKDVVTANLLAGAAEGAAGHVFNVGTGDFVRINRLWDMIGQMAGISLEPRYEEARAGDILESLAGIERARAILGFDPVYNFGRGLDLTFKWYQKEFESGRSGAGINV
jgi:UDP-glucose 4-epimerase